MSIIRLLLVDDRDIVRDSLKLFFASSDEIRIVGEASDGEEAIDLATNMEYDVVLMDINMPIMDGIQATKKLIEIKPNIKILAYSFNNNPYYIMDIINAGALGFIKKDDDSMNFIKAIKTVHNNEVYLSDEITQLLTEKIKFPNTSEALPI